MQAWFQFDSDGAIRTGDSASDRREVFDRMSWRSESMAEAEAAFALQMRAGLLNPTGDAHEVRMGPAPTVPVDVQMPAVHGMGASPGSFGIPSFGALRGMR